ncbi:DNA replication/repair protein RecF [Novosphingobium sp.]|uniref:DNA replication/repair protein RecF n=1 Tax=Novosphingobium sp. TaxID=1874826 RepID=UPI0022BEFC7D|nr:DNA replication/repair protein RecF [Novosphingobium sp.]MCZ8019861.1 DNA replication/repair protein RecF [Novosphingobium sp.]MCZ8035813.1 DNA replication/repair protein RecF [Novosphingobium sp.]MCZ8052690.1 DNA replication/repair protein RecF [Novosphingobium sp.]MCZ8060794.1 DNA replication/repair protein RecF [Novosphingobium sp.]MCZ8233366.1 DNA replication/repair protein RecF [Novosphingobium sp.]
MALDRITLTHFRNHPATRLEETAQFNLLVGENGAGKTNVLEALSLLAPGRGLRRAALTELPGHSGDGGCAVSADLAGGGSLGTGIRPDRPGRRVARANGAEIAALGLSEWLSIGWLTPAMDRLFSEGAGARRRFLDRLVLALEPGHARHAARMESALRERNRLLAEPAEPDPAWLDALESQLAEAGALVAQARARLVTALAERLALLPEAPFARPELAYQPGGPLEAEALAAELRATRRRDRGAGRTLTGPHRDELGVVMAGKGQPAAACSTGEQKALLIAITLAHADLLEDSRPALLLLDEVAAHLDPLRRSALFDRLRAGRAQVWLTGTELPPFEAIAAEAAVWRVRDGSVERLT